MSSTNAYEIDDVVYSYGASPALRNVTFTVPVGAVLGLVGDNGAGKTTLLSILARLRRAASGRLSGPQQRAWSSVRIGWMASDEIVLPDVAVGRFLGDVYGPTLGMHRDDAHARCEDLAQRLGVAEFLGSRPARMSRGQRIRCAMIAALLERPELVLLDEPFLGLDPTATDRAHETLIAERDAHGMTFVVSDHRLDVLEHLCDVWSFLVGGQIVTSLDRASLRETGELAVRYREAVTAREPS